MNKVLVLSLPLLLSACAMPERYQAMPEVNQGNGNVTVDASLINDRISIESQVSSGNTTVIYNLQSPLSDYVANSLHADQPVSIEMLSMEVSVVPSLSGVFDYTCTLMSNIQGQAKFNKYAYTKDEGFTVMAKDVGNTGILGCLDKYIADTQKSIDAL